MSALGKTGGFAGNDFSRIVRAEDPVAFHLSATLKVFVGVGDGDGTGAAVDVEDGVGTRESGLVLEALNLEVATPLQLQLHLQFHQ